MAARLDHLGIALGGRGFRMTQRPRVGVFLCHCGSNIAGHLDVPTVAELMQRIMDEAGVILDRINKNRG